ncbi:MAG: response regulator [Acetatifactor sp.]|nr:response regulator [Acetatifactor sp.]
MKLIYDIDYEAAVAVFLAILYLYVWLQCSRQDGVILLFRRLILIAFLADITDIAATVTISCRMSDSYTAALLLKTMYYWCTGVLGFWFARYAFFYVHGVLERFSFLLIHKVLLGIYSFTLLANLPRGFFFSVGENGEFQRGDAYLLVYLLPFFFYLYGIYEMAKAFRWYDKVQKTLSVSFWLGSFLGPALQFFFFPRTLLAMVTPSFGMLLLFFQIHALELQLMSVEYELKDMIAECCGYMKSRINTLGFSCGIRVVNHPDTPRVLYGDVTRIRQIVIEMFLLAVDTAHDGYVCIGINKRQMKEDEILLQLTVEGGSCMKDRKRLSAKTMRLVELMKGSVDVEKTSDGHFKISMCVPQLVIEKEGMGTLYEQDVYSPNSGISKFLRWKASDVQVLVVDDLPINVHIVKGLLDGTGIVVEGAYSGVELLEKIVTTKYDLIFLDDSMPGMSGVEALKRMRRMPNANGSTPVIALTANTEFGVREKYIEQGFSGYLAKPISDEELGKTLLGFMPPEKIQ